MEPLLKALLASHAAEQRNARDSTSSNSIMEDVDAATAADPSKQEPSTITTSTATATELESKHGEGREANAEKGMLDKVYDFLVEEDWKGVQLDRDSSTLHLGMGGSNGSYRVALHCQADDNVLIVLVQCPVKVPPEKRLTVAEYLTRANYGITIGSFEMDLGDGEVRYKGSVDVADGQLTAKMVDRLLGKCCYTMNRYFTGLMKIIYGDVNAMEAIREAEPLQARGEALSMMEALASAIAVQVVNDEDDQEASTTPNHGVTVEVLEDDEDEDNENDNNEEGNENNEDNGAGEEDVDPALD